MRLEVYLGFNYFFFRPAMKWLVMKFDRQGPLNLQVNVVRQFQPE